MIGAQFKKLGLFIGKVQTTLLSAILYYFLITPIGLIFQLVTSIKKAFSVKQDTYWLPREPEKDLKDIYQQF